VTSVAADGTAPVIVALLLTLRPPAPTPPPDAGDDGGLPDAYLAGESTSSLLCFCSATITRAN